MFQASVKDQATQATNMLQCSVSPDIKDPSGRTPLILAVSNGSANVLKVLLESKAKKNVKCKDGKTLFEIAVDKGNAQTSG